MPRVYISQYDDEGYKNNAVGPINGLYFFGLHSNEITQTVPEAYRDLMKVRVLVSQLNVATREEQDSVLDDNPWIMEILGYEPRYIQYEGRPITVSLVEAKQALQKLLMLGVEPITD